MRESSLSIEIAVEIPSQAEDDVLNLFLSLRVSSPEHSGERPRQSPYRDKEIASSTAFPRNERSLFKPTQPLALPQEHSQDVSPSRPFLLSTFQNYTFRLILLAVSPYNQIEN